MFTQKFLISVIVGLCSTVPASATLVTYCGYSSCSVNDAGSAFTAATSADTFSDISVTQGSLGDSHTDATGVEFSDPAGMTGTANPSGWPTGTAIVANGTAEGNTMTLTLPSDVDAIEFYGGGQDFTGLELSVTDSTGATYTTGLFGQNNLMVPAFFGATSTGMLTSVSITGFSSPDKITLDDIMIGSSGSSGSGDPSPAPEVTSSLLVGSGLFLIGYFRRITQAARRGTVRTISTGITPA
jgi:hypothetical protein